MKNPKYHHILPEVIKDLESNEPFIKIKKQATRYSYSEALLELGKKNEKVVVLDADVSKSLKTTEFAKEFPNREFNFGISEQNMVSSAAGFVSSGLIPYVSGYAVFLCMRALDQVRNNIHYPRLNVKIFASHVGLTPGTDGVTHQAQEDLSIMRSIAGSCVIAPSDPIICKKATFAAADYEGPVYVSLTREPIPFLYADDVPFEIGKAIIIREGCDVTIIANRDLVSQALYASISLERKGISAKVIDCHTIKPLDEELILRAARETKAIVTAEDNIKFGGLGSAVAELLVENYPIPMQRIAIDDNFAESGPYFSLLEKYGLSSNHIEKAVLKVLKRKKDI